MSKLMMSIKELLNCFLILPFLKTPTVPRGKMTKAA